MIDISMNIDSANYFLLIFKWRDFSLMLLVDKEFYCLLVIVLGVFFVSYFVLN